jgi:hypothetical protein
MGRRWKGWRKTTTYTCRFCDSDTESQKYWVSWRGGFGGEIHSNKTWKESEFRSYKDESQIEEIVSLVIGKGWRIALFFFFFFLYLLLGILNFLNLFGFDNINTTITFYTYTRLYSCGTWLKFFFFPITKYSFGEFGLGCVLINSPR